MTEFPTRPTDTQMKLTIDHQSAANAGADGKDCQGIHTAARAETPFTIRDRADIVKYLNFARNSGTLLRFWSKTS